MDNLLTDSRRPDDRIRGYYATLTLEFDDQVSLDDALYTAGRLTKELRIGAVKFDWDKGAVTYYVNSNGTVLQKIKSEVTTVMRPGKEDQQYE